VAAAWPRLDRTGGHFSWVASPCWVALVVRICSAAHNRSQNLRSERTVTLTYRLTGVRCVLVRRKRRAASRDPVISRRTITNGPFSRPKRFVSEGLAKTNRA
jgi:hypothetical protein